MDNSTESPGQMRVNPASEISIPSAATPTEVVASRASSKSSSSNIYANAIHWHSPAAINGTLKAI